MWIDVNSTTSKQGLSESRTRHDRYSLQKYSEIQNGTNKIILIRKSISIYLNIMNTLHILTRNFWIALPDPMHPDYAQMWSLEDK